VIYFVFLKRHPFSSFKAFMR